MRAVCEACGAPQPPEWRPGELCGACGAAVRRDVRCFWCAKWTPFARFCRSCGAEVVEETLYGAARMLKDAGTDRFTVPRMLRELDTAQVENFSRIYQRHAVAVARHADEVRFLERFLFHKSFSAALEEELVPQLPWPEEALARFSGPPLPPGDDLATARAIEASTPFGLTRSLAALARLRLDDGGAFRAAQGVFASHDPALRAEAALVLTGWRVRAIAGRLREEQALLEELRRSPFRLAAGVRLVRDPDLLREALSSPDREISFAAALALGDVDRLQSALAGGDDLERAVAGSKLIELGIIKPVEEPIRKSPLEVQRELIEALVHRKDPAPELESTLLEIVETTGDSTLRERAARVLCRKLRPELALRIARAAKGERYIFQSLLSEGAALPPETLSELVAWMLADGRFAMSQYGLAEAARRGAIPDRFVPSVFAGAGEETRADLLRLAEVQLEARRDEALHRFVLNVVYGPFPAATRAAAWWALRRTYRRDDVRAEGPFRIEKATIERFFGSVRAFIPRLAAVLRDPATLKEVGLYEHLATVLGEADPEAAPAFFAEENAAHDLVRALLEALSGDTWPQLRSGMVKFLGVVGTHPLWRGEAVAELARLHQAGQTGDAYWSERILKRLRVSPLGLSEDEETWRTLPAELVIERFEGADEETRRLLLQVAEMQLRERWGKPKGRKPEEEKLLPFLLGIVLAPGELRTRAEAMKVYAYWSRDAGFEFRLRPDRIARYFGSPRALLPRLSAALRDFAWLEEGGGAEFMAGLLEGADPAAAQALLKEEEAAHDLVRALLACAACEDGDLGERALEFLGLIGGHPRWREETAAELRRLAESPGFACARALDLALERILPPPPPSSKPEPPPEAPAPQQEVERLARELQEAAMRISFGPGSPEEKARLIQKLQADFQARIQQLYR